MFPKDTKILICDDMPAIRDMLVRELRQLGYTRATSAIDGLEGLAAFKEALNSDPFGLIISDWNMPKLNGYEFLLEVRKHPTAGDTPFVILTAEGQKEQVMQAIAAGVTQYILKPFTPKNLTEKLQTAWQKANASKRA